jgi:hypothetical protein
MSEKSKQRSSEHSLLCYSELLLAVVLLRGELCWVRRERGDLRGGS